MRLAYNGMILAFQWKQDVGRCRPTRISVTRPRDGQRPPKVMSWKKESEAALRKLLWWAWMSLMPDLFRVPSRWWKQWGAVEKTTASRDAIKWMARLDWERWVSPLVFAPLHWVHFKLPIRSGRLTQLSVGWSHFRVNQENMDKRSW